jgi:NAD(P)-dependent dehydrogenase (short-subunit alcohol dehydrogenase family)
MSPAQLTGNATSTTPSPPLAKIDVLFLNAGVSGELLPVTELSEASFDHVMAVNVRGVFLGCKYGLPQMNDGGSGWRWGERAKTEYFLRLIPVVLARPPLAHSFFKHTNL